jgi:hypothetical protein
MSNQCGVFAGTLIEITPGVQDGVNTVVWVKKERPSAVYEETPLEVRMPMLIQELLT